MISIRCILGFCAVILACSAPALGAQISERDQTADNISGSVIFRRPSTFDSSFFTLTLENDLFVSDDDGFTNGLGLTYGRGPFTTFSTNNLPRLFLWLADRTYISSNPNKIRGIAYHVAQVIQTPTEITVAEPQPDDLPWAGFLKLESTLYAWDKNTSDQLTFEIGAVGPVALAREAQTLVHEITGSDIPRGWRNQIENELVFGVTAVRNQKLFRHYGPKYGFDVIGIGQAGIGTILSSVSGGVALRFGTNMEFSHATFDLLPDRQVNSLALSTTNDFYTYVGTSGTYVFNDILIDGNTFRDSPSVDLEHAQNLITGGVVLKAGRFAYVFQVSSFSARATFASGRESLGALSVTFAF